MLKINRSSVKREKIIDIGLRINLLKMRISVYCRQNNLKDVKTIICNFFLTKIINKEDCISYGSRQSKVRNFHDIVVGEQHIPKEGRL